MLRTLLCGCCWLGTLLCVAGCTTGFADDPDGGYYAWGKRGLEDGEPERTSGRVKPPTPPRFYHLDPNKPRQTEYPGFAIAEVALEPAPNLQPLPSHRLQHPHAGIQPLSVQVNRDQLDGGRPVEGAPMDPNGMLPLEQLIYGGPYGEQGDPQTYAVVVGDKLRVRIERHPEFIEEEMRLRPDVDADAAAVMTVREDGTLRIPGTQDSVQAAGLTPAHIAEAIGKTIRRYVRRTPVVRVSVALGHGGYYYVFGAVRHQGRFALGTRPVRLSEAVFLANSERFEAGMDKTRDEALAEELARGVRVNYGKEWRAKMRSVTLITPHRTHPVRQICDVTAALFEGRKREDPIVKPGQIVIVDKGLDRKVVDYLNNVLSGITFAPRVE